jgi:hypothetical protein
MASSYSIGSVTGGEVRVHMASAELGMLEMLVRGPAMVPVKWRALTHPGEVDVRFVLCRGNQPFLSVPSRSC